MLKLQRIRHLLRKLGLSERGVAAVEFALIMPILLLALLYGAEMAWYMMVNLRVSQVALQVADNASRIGDSSTMSNRKIYEADINDVMLGAHLNGGSMLNLLSNGRIIVSSLQVNTSGQQFIKWQRCKGVKNVGSSYGVTNDIKSGGIGPAGQEVTALTDDAVIFVEIQYDYKPLISTRLISNKTIKTTAAFNVRDSRDLSQVYQTSPAGAVASCSTYTAT
ncbi:TadE/TadG family type IV pilus assembly protein [Novosphingobium sp. TH158]|uniref:TadE/TadG family type IV pilus assembly protein n=1 Tax=Novosphingobium sp. TH158 TaxID=2067455 RepID=UPI000C7BE93D|nr:TadE/TadG family type IV pilus assembly protein [Novosphingobium sp. TH158]PLK25838.1 tight adherence protein TadE [Novosphingobium sp. TH158]